MVAVRPKIVSLVTVVAVIASFLMAIVMAGPASATTANPTPGAGQRKNATTVPFTVSGTTNLSVDVGTGNGLVTDQLLTLPGVTGDMPIVLWYNSSVWGGSVPSAVTGGTGSGWGITGFDQRIVANADGSATYYGQDGLSGVFVSSGTGTYTAPAQFQATLTSSGSGWSLLDHQSQSTFTFNTSGRLTQVADRNSNLTTFGYDPYSNPASITTSRGPSAGRVLTVTMSSGRIGTLSQTSGTLSRSLTFGYSTGGHLASITDDVSGVTSFASAYGTDTGQVVTITNPKSKTTTLSFATGGQVASVAQANPPIDGGAGQSTTRLTYPSATQTLEADPTTNQSLAVSAVPHTTYTINSTSQLVTSAQDPDGNTRAATYTSINNVASATPAAGGASTFTYGANSGESMTQAATAAGASQSAAYTNTGAAAYEPSSATNDASNALQFTYNGQGNQLTSQQGTSGPQAVVTYNSNGTPATSASPGAGVGVNTAFGYDTNFDQTSETPPSGTSLVARAYTWDGFGRLSTATDGRSNTTTYTYDNADRITKIHSSASGTTDVGYTYDALNEVTQRTDASGTTTYTYDDLRHLLTVGNTAGGGTLTYTYDLGGNEATIVTGQGTSTYGYDAAHLLTSITYLQGGYPQYMVFANDANGRRTDAWLQTGSASTHTAWAAHEQLTYDTSGRVTGALGQNGPATAPVNVINETLCYSAGATAPSCPTTSTADRSNVQWLSDTVTGETDTYGYDTSNRLHTVTVTGGGNPRTYTYGYDSAGNRTSSAVTGTSPSSQSLTYNAGNQITTTGYTYDGAGNLTAWPGFTATYNGDEQQVTTVTGGVTTSYVYSGATQNELTSESTSGGDVYKYAYGKADANGLPEIETVNWNTNIGYLLHDNTGLPVMLQTNSALTCMYLYDGIGNPVALANSANTVAYNLRYDPYGATTRLDSAGGNGGWLENPYVFQGGLQDRATGDIKFGARWYNPTTGNWTTQDARNAPLDPGNANRYAFAADDPINHSDPTGLLWSWLNRALNDAVDQSWQQAVVGAYTGCVTDIVTGCIPGAIAGAFSGAISGYVSGFAYGAAASLSNDLWGYNGP